MERLKLQLDAQEKMDNINIESKRFSMEMQRYNAGLDSKFGKKRKGAKGIPRGIQKGFDDARSRQAEMLKKAEETRDPVARQSYLQEGERAYERMMQFQKMIDDRFGIKSPDKTDFKFGEMPPPKKSEKTEWEIEKLKAQTAKLNKEIKQIDSNISQAEQSAFRAGEAAVLKERRADLQSVKLAVEAYRATSRDDEADDDVIDDAREHYLNLQRSYNAKYGVAGAGNDKQLDAVFGANE